IQLYKWSKCFSTLSGCRNLETIRGGVIQPYDETVSVPSAGVGTSKLSALQPEGRVEKIRFSTLSGCRNLETGWRGSRGSALSGVSVPSAGVGTSKRYSGSAAKSC